MFFFSFKSNLKIISKKLILDFRFSIKNRPTFLLLVCHKQALEQKRIITRAHAYIFQ